MVTNWSKAGSSAAPPHELNVWKFAESRAPELQGLHSIVAQRLGNNFQSQRNKRRRTTGHDNRVAKNKFKKRKTGIGGTDKSDSGTKDESKVPRRVRRRIELKKNPSSGFGTSGDGTKRLRTHVWHAKRFTMTKRWGFHIPLGLHGRGRGSRALLKKLKQGVLIHDASYYGCVQMEGPEGTLESVLSSMLVPSPLAYYKETGNGILAGTSFGTAMIYHTGKPCDPPIAPVTYMWRAVQHVSSNKEGLNTNDFDGGQKIDDGNVIRQVWMWIHAAAFREAYDALCNTCERLVNTPCSVRCVSREGQLAKLELMGSKAFLLLQKTLLPVTSFEHSGYTEKCLAEKLADPGELEKTSIFENEDQISSSAVLSLVVKDPRTSTKKVKTIVPEGKPFVHEECHNKEQSISSLPKNETECVFESGDLWDTTEGVCPPVEESVLCMEKQHRRMEFFRLGCKSSGSQSAFVDGKYSRVCPILLLRKENHEDSVLRYTIILPLSWVKAFWITFISNGAHAIGLREKHWVSCMAGLPYFPLDFPDCNAFSALMTKDPNAFCEKARLLEIPISLPWDVVHLTFEKLLTEVENSLSKAAEFSIQDGKTNMARNSVYGGTEAKDSDCQGAPSQRSIVRTSYILNAFLDNTSANKLLLFPKLCDQKRCLSKFMKDDEFLKQDTDFSGVNCGKTSFYIRVLLHAYKEGVFEQGAVVCAPRVDDITLWTDRSASDNQNLQIPQSLLQLLPSAGLLQVHEELTHCESYRWPIGFVTTGFVQGSKKAIAVAVCEASLLSRLREEQWKSFPVCQRRKEIYVLVRNIKSTAYRLALATIVLEQQEDVRFM